MKTPLCISLLTLFGAAALADDPKPAATPPAEVTGKATITIEVNGKKVTREVDLGKATQLQPTLDINTYTGSTIVNDPGKRKAPAKLRTWLGVRGEDLTDDLRGQLPIATGTGVLLREVFADDPAAKAGLQKNDVLVRFDNQILTNTGQLYVLILTRKEGDTVRLTYLRKGQEASAEAKLGTHPEDSDLDKTTLVRRLALDLTGRPPTPEEVARFVADDSPDATNRLVSRLLQSPGGDAASGKVDGLVTGALKLAAGETYSAMVGASPLNAGENPLLLKRYAAFDKDGNLAVNGTTIPIDAPKNAPSEVRTWLGVATEEPSDDVRSQLPVAASTGLLIRSVIADSPAAKAGLENNDVLFRVDDQILTNPNQLRTLIGTKKDGDTVQVTYLRKGQEASAQVKLASHAEDDSPQAVQKGVNWIVNHLQRDPARQWDANGVFVLQDPSGAPQNKAAVNAQWNLFFATEGLDAANEAVKQLEKSLRDAGVNEQVIKETRKALADTSAALRKSASDVDMARANLQRELQKATEEIKRAVEKAWHVDPNAAPKPKPAPPADKAP